MDVAPAGPSGVTAGGTVAKCWFRQHVPKAPEVDMSHDQPNRIRARRVVFSWGKRIYVGVVLVFLKPGIKYLWRAPRVIDMARRARVARRG